MNVYRPSQAYMYALRIPKGTTIEDAMPLVLASAVRHAHQVMSRPQHRNSSRIDRVLQFVSSIRSILSHTKYNLERDSGYFSDYRAIEKLLCDKKIWSDIGVLEPDAVVRHRMPFFHEFTSTPMTIRNWLTRTPYVNLGSEEDIEHIDREIDTLGVEVRAMRSITERMERLNVQAQSVADNLVAEMAN